MDFRLQSDKLLSEVLSDISPPAVANSQPPPVVAKSQPPPAVAKSQTPQSNIVPPTENHNNNHQLPQQSGEKLKLLQIA